MARNTPVRAQKEELFMRVIVDDAPVFLNVTSHVGKTSPYTSKVKSSVGFRVSPDVAAYSLLQVTKSSMKRLVDKPLQIPRGTLGHLESTATQMVKDDTLGKDELVAFFDGTEYRFSLAIDDAGVLTVEPKFEDDPFELPPRAMRYDLFLRSPKVDRVLAVSFSGHLDRKPGESETRTRAVLKVLANLSGLANFHLLAGFAAVDMPGAPSGPPIAPKRKADDKVIFDVPTCVFTEDGADVVGQGTVSVEVDLDHANASTGQLLYHIAPDEQLTSVFAVYKSTMADAIATEVRKLMSEAEQRDLTYDIVLGDVSVGSIDRLRDITAQVPALDLTPTQYRARV